MNIHAAPAQAAAARRSEAENGSGPAASQEIKYREDAAGYVAAMLAELRQIAGKAGFDKLVKSIDTAYYDAYAALDPRGREGATAPQDLPLKQPLQKTANSMEPNGA